MGLSTAWAAHGYALWGALKYPPGFTHFDYVDPTAPKGGEIRLVSNLRNSTFDKYNPFTLRGSAPAYLSNLMFDSLLTGSLDETGSGYGYTADAGIEVAARILAGELQPGFQSPASAYGPELAIAAGGVFRDLPARTE